jgi:hypothetical protein
MWFKGFLNLPGECYCLGLIAGEIGKLDGNRTQAVIQRSQLGAIGLHLEIGRVLVKRELICCPANSRQRQDAMP